MMDYGRHNRDGGHVEAPEEYADEIISIYNQMSV